jgi:hypothetical protein
MSLKKTPRLTDEQLSGLTFKEKLELLDVIEELEQREREKPDNFVPNDGQIQVIRSDALIRAVFAGNGGGKTALGTNEAGWAAYGYNPVTKEHTRVPTRGIVVLDRPEKVADVWLPELRKWFQITGEQLHKRGKPYYNHITFDNGSEILFMFHDQDPMAFESLEIDWVIFDEPPPRPVFVSLMRGGRKKDSNPWYLIIGTPIAAPWLRKEIYEPWARGERDDIECFRYGTEVNKANLKEGYIEQFSAVLSEKEKRIRLQGEFFDLEGLALAHLFDRSTHVVDHYPGWKDTWPCVVAIDPHPRKAHTAILLGVSPDDNLFVIKEMSSRAVPSQFARDLRAFYQGYRVVDIVCDSLGSSELTGGYGNLSFIQVLKNGGVRVRPTTFDEKKDEAWIQTVQEVLAVPIEANRFGQKEPRLKVHSSCKGLIADFETVEWAKYRNIDEFKPKLAIEAKDFLSCLKYALAAQPRFNKGKERIIGSSKVRGWNQNEKWRRRTSG